MSEQLGITLYSDGDGFISFECPFCGSVFKLSVGDLNDETFPVQELFCPYCGLVAEKKSFLSAEAKEAIQAKIYNYAVEMFNQGFGEMSKTINRQNSMLKVEYKPLTKEKEKDVIENDTVETNFCCKACEREVKVLLNIGLSKAFCPYCGVDI